TRIAAETASEMVEGTGGKVVVHSQSVELRHGAEISVSSFGAGDAGVVDITTDTLRLEASDTQQFPTQISANAAPIFGTQAGAGGGIVIHAGLVELANGAGIMAAAPADSNAGTITIQSDALNIKTGGITTFTAGAGNGGEININSRAI